MTWDLKKYIDVIVRFLEGRISAQVFDTTYREIWMKDINREHASTTPEQEQEGRLLLNAAHGGEISSDEFSKRWKKLHNTTEVDSAVGSALGELHSRCSDYTTNELLLTSGAYVSESELRDHARRVLRILREYETPHMNE